MKITIYITEGEMTAGTVADSLSVGGTAPTPDGQSASIQDINAGPAPALQITSPGGQSASAAPAVADGTGAEPADISAGPAPAELTGDSGLPETRS